MSSLKEQPFAATNLIRVVGLFGRSPLSFYPQLTTMLPVLALSSLFWAAWDPTYLTVQRARIQGRDVRLHGKRSYIVSHISVAFVYVEAYK